MRRLHLLAALVALLPPITALAQAPLDPAN